MKDSILCAIDFSESSVHALRWAAKLAAGSNADLTVLFSYRLIQTGKVNDILTFKRQTEEESKQRFNELEKKEFPLATTETKFITEIGFFSDNIEKFVRKNPLSLVVLSETLADSIRDHKGFSMLDFMKIIHVPLLIVPDTLDVNSIPVFHKDHVY